MKVWLGGEGTCELGGRADGDDRRGVIEALLLRLESVGWTVVGATRWKYIRKFTARGALQKGENHGDIKNVMGLALEAHEAASEVLAFTRDIDADDERMKAIATGLEQAANLFPTLAIIGGGAKPAIEGWVLALRKVSRTDEMSRQRTLEELKAIGISAKSPEEYVAVVEQADLEQQLPGGCDSLVTWLATARGVMARALRGE